MLYKKKKAAPKHQIVMNNNFKFILGIAVGAAVGTALGYAVASGKKEEWLGSLEEKAEKAKDELEIVIDKISKSVQGIVSRA